MRSVRNLLIAGLASTVAVCQFVHAADWRFDPRVTLSGNYVDNYGLEGGGAQGVSVVGPIFEAAVKVRYANPLTQFEITPRARSSLYPGHAQDQSNDQFVTARFEHDWRTAQFTTDGFYWRQNILQSYLPSTEVGTPLGQNTGGADIGTLEKIRQNLLFLTPGALFDVSPRARIEVRTQFMDVGYSKQIANTNEDFRSYTGSAGFQYSITPRSTMTIRGTGSKLSPTAGSGAETYGLEGEWKTQSSEVLQAYARLGVDHTTFDSATSNQSVGLYNRSSATSFAGGVGLSRKFVRNDLFVDLLRTMSPNSAGAVVTRDELRLRLEHEFTARMSAYVGLRGIKEDALGHSTGFVSQRYGRGAVGFEWRILQALSLVPEYAYTSLKQGAGKGAGSNSVMISLVYEPHRPATETGVRIGL